MSDPASGSLTLKLAVVGLLVVANAFFVSAEFALVASRRTRLEAMIRRGEGRARLARRAVLSLNRMISGTQLGVTLASLGLGWVGEPAVARAVAALFAALPAGLAAVLTHGVAVAVAFLAITFLHIVLGELVPKAMSLLFPERVASWVAGPLIAFTVATNPFIWALNFGANLVLRLFGLRAPTHIERLHSSEELRMLVEQSHQAGALEKEDARLLAGVFEFSEKTAREVMTPRTQITALEVDDSIAAAADRIAAAGRSRYPVYRASLDDIVGIVHAKDVLAAMVADARDAPATVEALLRPAYFVPASREIEDVLADMKLRKAHMVLVLDEFGGTAGLVTMEDLLEEIVGQIEDEYDRAAPAPAAAADATVFPGGAGLDDVNARLGLALASADYTTIGGYLFGALGRLPKVGDLVAQPAGVFEVTAMDGRRIAQVRYRPRGAP